MTSATARPPPTAANASGSNLRVETYTANALNQYTQRTVPGFAFSPNGVVAIVAGRCHNPVGVGCPAIRFPW